PVPAGRGLKSHAYIHSVQLSHHVFLNLHTLKFYCLPDNYEIIDSSLEDITYVLKPTFTAQQIANLDRQVRWHHVPAGHRGAQQHQSQRLRQRRAAGLVQRPATAELFFGGGELRADPAPARGRDVPAGAALRGAHAEALEPPEFQSPRLSPRDAAGRGALQQEELPDHQARRRGGIPVLVPQRAALSPGRHQEEEEDHRHRRLPGLHAHLHQEASSPGSAGRGEGAAPAERRVPGDDGGIHLHVPDAGPAHCPALQGREGAAHHPPGPALQHLGQVQRCHREGVQDLQGELPQALPAHQAAALPHLLHQALHQEQLLCGEEPHHRQLPHHERGPARVPVGGGAGRPRQHHLRPDRQHRARRETLRAPTASTCCTTAPGSGTSCRTCRSPTSCPR
ncbi:ubiquitin specific peptidase 39, partial [Columba livia]